MAAPSAALPILAAPDTAGEKTLRAYTVSLNLARFDRQDWLARDETMDGIAAALDTLRKVPGLTRQNCLLTLTSPETVQ